VEEQVRRCSLCGIFVANMCCCDLRCAYFEICATRYIIRIIYALTLLRQALVDGGALAVEVRQ
jgi:hypothetical protein